jgi:hypothetical protein
MTPKSASELTVNAESFGESVRGFNHFVWSGKPSILKAVMQVVLPVFFFALSLWGGVAALRFLLHFTAK